MPYIGALVAALLLLLPAAGGSAVAASAPAAEGAARYEIPLSELHGIINKQPARKKAKAPASRARDVKTAPAAAPAPRPVSPPVQPPPAQKPVEHAGWPELTAITKRDDGIRLEVTGLTLPVVLLRDMESRKVILQLAGVRYLPEEIRTPLDSHGFTAARVGHHSDGIWVVLDSGAGELPLFDVVQDRSGITLLMDAGEAAKERLEARGRVMLLGRDVLPSAGRHLLPPARFERPPEAAGKGAPRPAFITHEPYSHVIPGRQSVIKAVISSDAGIASVRCIVTGAGSEPVTVPLRRAEGTRFTYEGKLPEAGPGSRQLSYIIVVIDPHGRETKSGSYILPVKDSPLMPGWQE